MENSFIFRFLVFIILFHGITNYTLAQDKTFIREYNYKAGETDSKISSRQKALTEVKALLIEELGTYVESYVNYEVAEENNKITRDFFTNEIKTLSAGTTETKIIEESWDGYEYYVKAEIAADPEEVLRRINETLSKRKSSEVIDSLNILLKSSNNELNSKNKELDLVKSQLTTKQKEIDTKQSTLNSLNSELTQAKQKLASYQAQEKLILSEIQAIEQKIKNATTKAVNNVRIGMTPNEVTQVCGNPRSTEECTTHLLYNYGNVWIYFESNIVMSVFDAKYYEGACCGSCSDYKRISKM
ncbi:MAG: hypothetical protein HOO86_04050 [Bacteroidales bacterium]|nr:hypothetical protein [Bacteroidales bacterium]